MEQGLILKIFKMDYDFIIKNYLDISLWDKEWTLFEYKNFKITITLDEIYTRTREIDFLIKVYYRDLQNRMGDSYRSTYAKYNMKIENIDFLKRNIESKIFELIEEIERSYFIKKTDKYYKIEELEDEERDRLVDIAEEFLDDNDVSSANIREAYIDAYIDEYSKVYEMKDKYENEMRYTMITDFYLVWLRSLDSKQAEARIRKVEENIEQSKLNEILKEVEKYEEYMQTETFQEEMQENLEEV